MKTMIKQRGFFAVLAVILLITAVLITTCSDPLGGGSLVKGDKESGENIRVPAGMGVIKLNFGEARTIMPEIPTPAQLALLYYYVDITDSVVTANDTAFGAMNAPVLYSTITQPITLTPTTTLSIAVYVFADNTGTIPIASRTVTNQTVPVNSVATIPIALIGNTATGAGTFAYDIVLPSNLGAVAVGTEGTLNIYDYGTTNLVQTRNLMTAASGTIASLPSGFYSVELKFTRQYFQDRVITQILHIYNTLTSTLDGGVDAFDDPIPYPIAALNQYAYTVVYTLNNGETPPTVTQPNVLHGTQFTYPGTPNPPVLAGSAFMGWFEDDGVFNEEWNIGVDRIIRALSLFAYFQASVTPGANITITFTTSDIGNTLSITNSGISYMITKNHGDAGAEITFTLSGTFDSVVWKFNEEEVSTGSSVTVNGAGASDDSLVAIPVGEHHFDIIVEVGGTPYSGRLPFSVTQYVEP